MLVRDYPFIPVEKEARRYTELQSAHIFVRDGFIDRYSGERLVYPGALRALSVIFPDEFPYHPNWGMDKTHIALWELFPTIDHVVPRSKGGRDSWANLVLACDKCNVKKGDRTPREAGMPLIRKPIKPHWLPKLGARVPTSKISSWQRFLDTAYWDAELRE